MSIVSKFLVLFLSIIMFTGCSKPEVLVDEDKYFEKHVKGHPELQKDQKKQDDFKLFYVSAGAIDKPAVVYIHGTPGGWDNAARYLMDESLREQVRVVAIDRPGWGGSQLPGGRAEPSFEAQARKISPLLKQLKADNHGQKVILLGHSLGASLAPRIAMDYPGFVDGLILMAGSLDPKLGSPRWYNLAASMGVVAWFLYPELQRANKEIMPLSAELKKMLHGWSTIKVPVTVIQGLEDKLVSPENADFIEAQLPAEQVSIIRLENAGHFIPWEHRDVVKRAIVDMLKVKSG